MLHIRGLALSPLTFGFLLLLLAGCQEQVIITEGVEPTPSPKAEVIEVFGVDECPETLYVYDYPPDIVTSFSGTIPTGFRSLDRHLCTFTTPVRKVEVVLTGPAKYTQTYTLAEPSTEVPFPLPEGTFFTPLRTVPPGQYRRQMTVTSVDGQTVVISNHQYAEKTVKILEPLWDPPIITKEVIIPSYQPWTDTQLAVWPGDLVSITASGSVAWDPNAALTGPDGTKNPSGTCKYVVTDPAVAGQSLIGNITELPTLDGKGFFVGHSFQGTVPISNTTQQSGSLFLGFNDGAVFCDRSGYGS